MRLWSLHPAYLDTRGLVALWREALLAQAVLLEQTKGYRNHPQLARFRACENPAAAIAAYLREVHAEATRRGHRFDAAKIVRAGEVGPMPVTHGQMAYEWQHLMAKLERRDPARRASLAAHENPAPHPLFFSVAGEVEAWEVVPRP